MKKLLFLFLSYMSCRNSCEHIEKLFLRDNVNENKDVRSTLYVFNPPESLKNGTSVIVCPGGSYHHLGLKHEGFEVAAWLNSLGITAYVLKYRVSLIGWRYPAMIQDLQRAIQLVREQATIRNLNPNSVGVMGFSAGAHLAGTASEYFEENFIEEAGIKTEVSLRPDFAVLVYPVISMHDSITHHRSKRSLLGNNHSVQLENKLSLEDNTHIGMPPLFITHAKDDSIVNYKNSYYFYQRLTQNNIKAKYFLYNSGGHGFGVKPRSSDDSSQWLSECEKWFGEIGIETRKVRN